MYRAYLRFKIASIMSVLSLLNAIAVTICGQGMDDNIFRTAFVSKFLDFARDHGRTRNITPIEADRLMYQKVPLNSLSLFIALTIKPGDSVLNGFLLLRFR